MPSQSQSNGQLGCKGRSPKPQYMKIHVVLVWGLGIGCGWKLSWGLDWVVELSGWERASGGEVVSLERVDVFGMRCVSSRGEFRHKGDRNLTSTFLIIVSLLRPTLPTLPLPF